VKRARMHLQLAEFTSAVCGSNFSLFFYRHDKANSVVVEKVPG